MMSPFPKNWSSRMLTLTYPCSDRETAAHLARTLAELARGALIRWEGLPGWETRFHVKAVHKHGADPQVTLLLWPEPHAE